MNSHDSQAHTTETPIIPTHVYTGAESSYLVTIAPNGTRPISRVATRVTIREVVTGAGSIPIGATVTLLKRHVNPRPAHELHSASVTKQLTVCACGCGANHATPDNSPTEARPTPPRYWVLPYARYADTESDYVRAANKAEVFAQLVDYGWMSNPAVHVYVGERTPWNEVDPYPDYVAERGPRGGVRWERA